MKVVKVHRGLFICCLVAGSSLNGVAFGADEKEDKTPKSCIAHLPDGARKPLLSLHAPDKVVAGHEFRVILRVVHLSGEKVLPWHEAPSSYEAGHHISSFHFAFPEKDAASPYFLRLLETKKANEWTHSDPSLSVSELEIPLVALPIKPHGQELSLPSLPLELVRPNGSHTVVCSDEKTIWVSDPTEEDQSSKSPQVQPNPNPNPNPSPKPNPDMLVQRVDWPLARFLFWGALLLIFGAVLGAYLFKRYQRRPKPLPPPAPLRPAWETALLRLDALMTGSLLGEEKYAKYAELAVDILRECLGSVYFFDGLECTSRELLYELKKRGAAPELLLTLKPLLDDTDLYKFAKLEPDRIEAEQVALVARSIVTGFAKEKEVASIEAATDGSKTPKIDGDGEEKGGKEAPPSGGKHLKRPSVTHDDNPPSSSEDKP